jgi:hypothetical protein
MPSPATPTLNATTGIPTQDLHPLHPALGVAMAQGHHHVVALEPVAAGRELLQIQGVLTETPHRCSVQVAARLHLSPPADLRPDSQPDLYLWRYLNHACQPNAAVVGRGLIALRDIAAGEEVTFDYNRNEYEIAEPFACHCGACGGRTIRGFKHLSAEEQARLLPILAPHLVALMPVQVA